MQILAIDPGTERSAFAHLVDGEPRHFGTCSNSFLLANLRTWCLDLLDVSDPPDMVVVEMIASYGMPVGREVFETCLWIGRFIEAWNSSYSLLYRRNVKLHLCNSARAKDANVAQALRDRFGEKGTRKNPGVLYGIRGDEWAALAVAVTWWDTQRAEEAVQVVERARGECRSPLA